MVFVLFLVPQIGFLFISEMPTITDGCLHRCHHQLNDLPDMFRPAARSCAQGENQVPSFCGPAVSNLKQVDWPSSFQLGVQMNCRYTISTVEPHFKDLKNDKLRHKPAGTVNGEKPEAQQSDHPIRNRLRICRSIPTSPFQDPELYIIYITDT